MPSFRNVSQKHKNMVLLLHKSDTNLIFSFLLVTRRAIFINIKLYNGGQEALLRLEQTFGLHIDVPFGLVGGATCGSLCFAIKGSVTVASGKPET